MRRQLTRHLRSVACAAALAVPLVLVGAVAPADAAPDGPAATGTYTCLLAPNDTETVQVTLSLAGVPAKVHPGQRVALTGTLSLGFPQQEAMRTLGHLATKMAISAADLGLAADAGSSRATVHAGKITGDAPVSVSLSAFTLTAQLRFAPYRVPASARDEVDLGLPVAASKDGPALRLTLERSGLVPQAVAATCTQGEDQHTAPIVRIPVARPAGAHQGGQQGGRQGGQQGGRQGGQQGGTTGADDTSDPGTPPSLPTTVTDPPPAQSPPSVAPSSQPAGLEEPADPVVAGRSAPTPTYAAIPPSTRRPGVFVPSWLLALGGLLVPVLALGYALTTHRRLRLVRARIAARTSAQTSAQTVTPGRST